MTKRSVIASHAQHTANAGSSSRPSAFRDSSKDLELGNVLLLLDGLDEILPDHFKENRLFLCLFNYPSFLLATRHHEIIPFEPHLRIELRDFDASRVRTYLKERKVNIDIKTLSEHELFNLISVPLHCYIFAEIWQPGMKLNLLNQYSLFTLFILTKLQRHLERNMPNIEVIKTMSLPRKLSFTQIYLDTLANLAVAHMGLIDQEVLSSFNKFIIDDLLSMGIIEILPQHESDTIKLRFKHKRFQEYFVAYYLIQGLLKNKVYEHYRFSCEMITQLRYQARYKTVFEFMSNIAADNQSLLLGSTQTLLTFWKLLLQPPIDFIGIKHNELIKNCLKRYSVGKFPDELSALKTILEPFLENTEIEEKLSEMRNLSLQDKQESLTTDLSEETTIPLISSETVKGYLTELNRSGPYQRSIKLNAIEQLANLPTEFIEQAAIGLAKSNFWFGYDNCHVELIRTLVNFNVSDPIILEKLARYADFKIYPNWWIHCEARIAQFHFGIFTCDDIFNLVIQLHNAPDAIPNSTCNRLNDIIKKMQLNTKQLEQLTKFIQNDKCPDKFCELTTELLLKHYDEYKSVYSIALNSKKVRYYSFKALFNYPDFAEEGYILIANKLQQFLSPLNGLSTAQALELIKIAVAKCVSNKISIKNLLITSLAKAEIRTSAVKLLIEHKLIDSETVHIILNSYDSFSEISQSGFPFVMKVATLKALSELHSQFDEQIARYLKKGFASNISYVVCEATNATRSLSQNINSLNELNNIINCLMQLYFHEKNPEYLNILFRVALNREMAMVFDDRKIILYGELDPLVINVSPLEDFSKIHKFFIEARNKILKDKNFPKNLPASLIFSENLRNVGIFRTINVPFGSTANNSYNLTLRKSL